MRTPRCFRRHVAPVVLAALAMTSTARASLQTVSVPDPFSPRSTAGGGDSANPILSPDGRFVLFASSANNLAMTASNTPFFPASLARINVYLRDRSNGTTKLVSVNLAGTSGGNGDSLPAGLSSDGRFALFESTAGDLVSGDTNNASDVFMRDIVAGSTVLISTRTNGGCANAASGSAVMTPDARYVAFASAASDLVPGDTNGITDIFVRDLRTGTPLLASPGATATGTDSSSDAPAITPDGRYVLFLSSATNLVAQPTSAGEVYVRDLVSGLTYLASVGARDWITNSIQPYCQLFSDDAQYVVYQANRLYPPSSGYVFRCNLSSGVTDLVTSNAVPALSGLRHFHNLDMTPDGRFIAFVGRPDPTPQSTNLCVYLWDGQTSTTTLVSADTNNAPTISAVCDWPAIDATGQSVAFLSTAVNLTTNLLLGEFHLYVRDVQAGTTRLVDGGTNAVGGAKSFLTAPRMTPNGRFVAFDCTDSDLVAGDNNHAYDIFVRDLGTESIELISTRQPALPSQTASGASARSVIAVSGDGQFIAFASTATDLVPNYNNAGQGLFVRDLAHGTNLLVSADVNGLPALGGWSTDPSVRADGRYVAFASGATNLVPADNNTFQDVFVRDLEAGTNYLVSVNSTRTGPGNAASFSPTISASGRQVLFRSRASTLASGGFIGNNVFWRDLQLGQTYAVTTSGSPCGAMTPDGRFVAYGRAAGGMYLWDSQIAANVYTNSTIVLSNITVSPDGNRLAGQTGSRIFVADRSAGTNWVIGESAPTTWLSHANLQFSADGQFLVYATTAALVPSDTNNTTDIYLYDFQAQTNLLISRSYAWDGAPNDASDSPAMSADGRFIAYRSAATDIVFGDTNGVPDVFLFDRQTRSTWLLSVSAFGNFAANNRSSSPVFSGDGQTLVFQSWASDLVAQDFNQGGDVFALRIAPTNSIPAFACQIVFVPNTGTPATLSWLSQPGTSYRVEFMDNLTDSSWQTLAGAVSIVGNRAYATDLSPGSAQRFYRIVSY